MLTKKWVESYDISSDPTPPTVPKYDEPCARTAREIAERTVILQGVVAVSYNVNPIPVIDWFRAQRVWDKVTPV